MKGISPSSSVYTPNGFIPAEKVTVGSQVLMYGRRGWRAAEIISREEEVVSCVRNVVVMGEKNRNLISAQGLHLFEGMPPRPTQAVAGNPVLLSDGAHVYQRPIAGIEWRWGLVANTRLLSFKVKGRRKNMLVDGFLVEAK